MGYLVLRLVPIGILFFGFFLFFFLWCRGLFVELKVALLILEFLRKEEKKTKVNHMQVNLNGNATGKKAPLLRRNTKSINVVIPEQEKKINPNEEHIEFRQYVFNPQFSTPTSLPVSFFFGYQILHELKEWEKRGHVSLVF